MIPTRAKINKITRVGALASALLGLGLSVYIQSNPELNRYSDVVKPYISKADEESKIASEYRDTIIKLNDTRSLLSYLSNNDVNEAEKISSNISRAQIELTKKSLEAKVEERNIREGNTKNGSIVRAYIKENEEIMDYSKHLIVDGLVYAFLFLAQGRMLKSLGRLEKWLDKTDSKLNLSDKTGK